MYLKIRKTIAVAAIVAISGCESLPMTGQVRGMKADASDVCDVYKDPLRQLDKDYNTKVFQSATWAALAGAAVGAAVADDEDRAKGAILGGVGGAIIGGVFGSRNAEAEKNRNKAQVEADLAGLAASESQKVSTITDSIRKMYDCRANQYVSLTESYKDGSITRSQAIEAKARIDSHVQIDEQLIDHVLSSADERFTEIVDYREGALRTSSVELSGPGKYYRVTAKDGLNIRSSPTSGSNKVGTLGADSYVKGELLVGKPWAKINLASGPGYASSSYLLEVSEDQATSVPKPSGNITTFAADIAENKTVQKQKEAELQRQKELAEALILG